MTLSCGTCQRIIFTPEVCLLQSPCWHNSSTILNPMLLDKCFCPQAPSRGGNQQQQQQQQQQKKTDAAIDEEKAAQQQNLKLPAWQEEIVKQTTSGTSASRAGSSSSIAAARRAKRHEAEGGSGTLPSSTNDSRSNRETSASTGDTSKKDTKGPQLRYDDEEHVLDSSTDYNGAVSGAIHVPGHGNNAPTSATTDESSSSVVVVTEVAPDRELLVNEAYEKGALDRERALQDVEVAVAVPDDDSLANGKKRRTMIRLVGLVVVIVAGDCDSDAGCQEGLRCFQRTGGMDVPGCSGGQQAVGSASMSLAAENRSTLADTPCNNIVQGYSAASHTAINTGE
eukprot:scaffold1041_cov121-Cylindrotheca_fusiformis.AAC.7